MGICDCFFGKNDKPNNEKIVNLGLIPNNFMVKASKSICKIKYKNSQGTGFFMNYNNFKLLVTNYHIIPEELLNESINLEFEDQTNNKSIVLQKDIRIIEFFEPPLDVAIIQIIETDEMDNIEYLDYDPDYKNGYKHYLQIDALAIGFPYGEEMKTGIGHIVNINSDNKNEFEHDIATERGSSGSPIILLNNKKVIGIHKASNEKNNQGTFIGAIIDELKKKIGLVKNPIDVDNISRNTFNSLNETAKYFYPFFPGTRVNTTISNNSILNSEIESLDSLIKRYRHSFNGSFYSNTNIEYSQKEIREKLMTNILNTESKKILYNTTIKGNLKEFKKLIIKGYPLLEEISPANFYWTPLHYAMFYGKMQIAFYILKKLKEKSISLYNKAMALETSDKRTPVLCLLRSSVLSPYSIGENFKELVENYPFQANEDELKDIRNRNLEESYKKSKYML